MTLADSSVVYNVRSFDAAGDGVALDTEAAQRAVDACAEGGGGTVFVPSGTYRVGTVRLRSNVTLHLAAGATILGSADLADYAKEGAGQLGLLYTRDATNVTIEGHGVIDGNGRAFKLPGKMHYETGSFDPARTRQGEGMLLAPGAMADGPCAMRARPGQAITFERCRRVLLRDVTIADTPHWATNFSDCDDVRVIGIRIDQDLLIPNGDGVHFNSCRDMVVSDCVIRAGDDAIALTAYTAHEDFDGFTSPKRPSENLLITNCLLVSRSAAIKIGPGQNDVRGVVVSNVVIRNSNRGLLVMQRDGSTISDLLFSNVVIETRLMAGGWWGKGEPIVLSSLRAHADSPVGRIERVRFNGITATSEAGVVLWADDDCRVDDVSITDLRLTIAGSPLAASHGGNLDFRNCDDRAKALFAADLAAVLCNKVFRVTLDRVDVTWAGQRPSYFIRALLVNRDSDVTAERFTERAQ